METSLGEGREDFGHLPGADPDLATECPELGNGAVEADSPLVDHGNVIEILVEISCAVSAWRRLWPCRLVELSLRGS
jgi:hypothetical protein